MSINYKEIPEHDAIELTVSGKVTQQEFQDLFRRFEAFIKEREHIKVLEVLEDVDPYPF